VTKHVRVLQDAGLVSRRLDGRRHLLSLESHRLLLAEDWIDRYRVMWTQSLHRLAALAENLETLPEPTTSPGLDPTDQGEPQ
jgi:DNA-binding transcriptional ArsR family regulator